MAPKRTSKPAWRPEIDVRNNLILVSGALITFIIFLSATVLDSPSSVVSRVPPPRSGSLLARLSAAIEPARAGLGRQARAPPLGNHDAHPEDLERVGANIRSDLELHKSDAASVTAASTVTAATAAAAAAAETLETTFYGELLVSLAKCDNRKLDQFPTNASGCASAVMLQPATLCSHIHFMWSNHGDHNCACVIPTRKCDTNNYRRSDVSSLYRIVPMRQEPRSFHAAVALAAAGQRCTKSRALGMMAGFNHSKTLLSNWCTGLVLAQSASSCSHTYFHLRVSSREPGAHCECAAPGARCGGTQPGNGEVGFFGGGEDMAPGNDTSVYVICR